MKRYLPIPLTLLALLAPTNAEALEIAVHDQGATPEVLTDVAGQLGARTARIIVRPGHPQIELVRAYRRAGLRVQAAITLKRWHTAGDVRALLRAWDGMVYAVSPGNEPELNGLSPCAYARVYRASYRLIRREFPGVRVGIREASPFDVVPFTERMFECLGGRDGLSRGSVRAGEASGDARGAHRAPRGRGRAAARSTGADCGRLSVGRAKPHRDCAGRALLADFFAIHPYCPDGDPLAPCQTQFKSGYTGIGDLARVKRWLRARSTRKWLSRPNGSALPLRITELSYFLDRGNAARMWPRAINQARKHAEQLVIYGLGPVHERSVWPSAALLDRFGTPTHALEMLAGALNRVLRRPWRPLAPAGDFVMPPPSDAHERAVAAGAEPPVDEHTSADEPPVTQDPPPTDVPVDDPLPIPIPEVEAPDEQHADADEG